MTASTLVLASARYRSRFCTASGLSYVFDITGSTGAAALKVSEFQ
jgi:hypothetical protein